MSSHIERLDVPNISGAHFSSLINHNYIVSFHVCHFLFVFLWTVFWFTALLTDEHVTIMDYIYVVMSYNYLHIQPFGRIDGCCAKHIYYIHLLGIVDEITNFLYLFICALKRNFLYCSWTRTSTTYKAYRISLNINLYYLKKNPSIEIFWWIWWIDMVNSYGKWKCFSNSGFPIGQTL